MYGVGACRKKQGLLANSAVHVCFCGIILRRMPQAMRSIVMMMMMMMIPDAPDDFFCDRLEAAKS